MASLVFTATVVVLLSATLGLFIQRRAAWGGFALFGWASLLLAFGPTQEATPLPRPLPSITVETLGTFLRVAPVSGPTESRWLYTTIRVRTAGKTVTALLSFLQVGNSLFALFAALIGCVVAQALPRRPDAAS